MECIWSTSTTKNRDSFACSLARRHFRMIFASRQIVFWASLRSSLPFIVGNSLKFLKSPTHDSRFVFRWTQWLKKSGEKKFPFFHCLYFKKFINENIKIDVYMKMGNFFFYIVIYFTLDCTFSHCFHSRFQMFPYLFHSSCFLFASTYS